jgi:hypothetical protein
VGPPNASIQRLDQIAVPGNDHRRMIPPAVFSIFAAEPEPLPKPDQPTVKGIAVREDEVTGTKLTGLSSLAGSESPVLGVNDWSKCLPLHFSASAAFSEFSIVCSRPLMGACCESTVKKRTRIGRTKNLNKRDAIRVVPLHHPAIALPAKATLTYRGGPLLSSVQVFTVFWGRLWTASTGSNELMNQINQFFTDVVASALIDQLSEYNVSGQQIDHGSFIGTKVIAANAPKTSVSDSAIHSQLKKWISSKMIPKNNSNSLYFIYLDPGVVSVMGGGRSCQSYCGYHNNVGSIYYAVMPYPGCAGCLGDLQVFDALTGTSSHELCEAITDPIPGKGWYDDTYGEIGDICAWQFKQLSSYTVQLEWSNKQRKCV